MATAKRVLAAMRRISEQQAHTDRQRLLVIFVQTFGLEDQAYATRFLSGTDSVLPKKRVQVQLRKLNGVSGFECVSCPKTVA